MANRDIGRGGGGGSVRPAQKPGSSPLAMVSQKIATRGEPRVKAAGTGVTVIDLHGWWSVLRPRRTAICFRTRQPDSVAGSEGPRSREAGDENVRTSSRVQENDSSSV